MIKTVGNLWILVFDMNGEQRVKYEQFLKLYRPLENDLFNYLKLMTNNEAMARDIQEDCLIIVFENFSSLRDKSKFKFWLWKIVKRQAIAYMKKYKREMPISEIHENEEKNILFTRSEISEIERVIFQIDNKKYIQHILSGLREKDVFFITCYYFNNLSYKEISKITGDSCQNLRVRHHRILKRLRDRAEKAIDMIVGE
ncbi:RNA polymerase sigma factor [Christensenella intestinihominis]|uniref:RNA polymerase sigma factor n=1 Tax=Christensenella intestinihominis TaxID=1851429 RepID=UPI0011C78503|nr:sigma-70 family RNA polymerase sigma factor [Christensenella intestinihominis]